MPTPHDQPSRSARRWWRLALTALLATVLVGGVLALPDSGTERVGDLLKRYDATKQKVVAAKVHESTPHRHDDPATKNLISRGGETAQDAQDPTTKAEAAAHTAAVAAQRKLRSPRLRTVLPTRPRTRVPADRYAMAGGCYTLQAPNGKYLARSGRGAATTATRARDAEPVTFRATDLGVYLLYGTTREFLANTGIWNARPSTKTEWTVRQVSGGFVLSTAGMYLAGDGDTARTPTTYRLATTTGCAAYPEVEVGVTGNPHAGVTSFQEVRGYVDAHTHGMAYEFLGGRVHCGKPWDPYGPAYALKDCADHRLTGGNGSLLETVLSGKPTHDPVGWPTFKDWPAPDSLTHEGTYYKWIERSWRGGQRLFTNLLVENNQLCQIYPLKKNSCDDMDSLRLQAKRMYEFQDYIDAQHGGPGRGWYRIVKSPFEARKVINAGKLAVVMGIETSVPFGCHFKKVPGIGDVPACNPKSIDRQLDEMRALGVRQMELVNKFDNALSGVAGDDGATGAVVNAANFLETGTFWNMQHCKPADGESADRSQFAAPNISAGQQDALFGAIGKVSGILSLAALPLYGTPLHCNQRGLTNLGTHLLDSMMDRGMMIDPDHMSVKARRAMLSQLEGRRYPGVLSSHSWSTPDAYPRIYALGGYVAPYAGDSTGFVEKWRRHLTWADPRYYFGFGFGADINGLGAQGDPRGTKVANPVRYPITGFNGVKVAQQRSGKRVYDLNRDGVAHYGLYPDWIADISKVAGRDGAALNSDMMRGAEAYLQTWERAVGIRPDSCRNPGLAVRAKKFRRLARKGTTLTTLLRRVGQPYQRLGKVFTHCVKVRTKKGKLRRVKAKVHLRASGKVRKVVVRRSR